MREEIIGDARLILGDCREVLPGLSGIDAVVTDPPYGIGWDRPDMFISPPSKPIQELHKAIQLSLTGDKP